MTKIYYGFEIYYDGAFITDNKNNWFDTVYEAEEEAISEIEWKMECWEEDEEEYDEMLFTFEIIEDEFTDVNAEISRWYDSVRM